MIALISRLKANSHMILEGLRERTEYIDIFFFPPSLNRVLFPMYVLFTGGREVSDFSVLKYY